MTQREIRELAQNTVGDGQEPNHFFVTTSPWIIVNEGEDTEQMEGFTADDFNTQMFDNYEEAKAHYDNTDLDYHLGIGTITLEDRKTGVIAEKRLEKIMVVDYSYTERDDSKFFGYEK